MSLVNHGIMLRTAQPDIMPALSCNVPSTMRCWGRGAADRVRCVTDGRRRCNHKQGSRRRCTAGGALATVPRMEECKRVCTESFWYCCQAMLLLALEQAEAEDAEMRAEEAAVAKMFEVLAKYRPKLAGGRRCGRAGAGRQGCARGQGGAAQPRELTSANGLWSMQMRSTHLVCVPLEPACSNFSLQNSVQVATSRSNRYIACNAVRARQRKGTMLPPTTGGDASMSSVAPP